MAPASRPIVAMASKAEKDADVVMGTNNSSIASKRSVEMIYYPRPHFFRYFVKKPQRRSPIINRGYWLRMYAMEETVRQFIAKAPVDKPKFVLNLGCGYDPLPFILLSDEQKSGKNGQTIFVDIDYEKLMIHKKNAIREAQEIKDVIGDVEFGSDEDGIQIRSSRYLGVGCDLKNLKKLNEVLLNSVLPSTDCSVLFLAEVSLTYMDVHSANEVVKWAAQLTNDVQFCILEQYFPDGPEHPFAKTMMTHFNKLRAPLFSIHQFPSLAEQEQRFVKAGWKQARARSLWELWSDDAFLSEATRTGLDSYEVFDEWEEFALFASHYFVLIASNNPASPEKLGSGTTMKDDLDLDASEKYTLRPYSPSGTTGRRRYGALVPGNKDLFGHHGGQGEQARLASTDLYSNAAKSEAHQFPLSRDIPAKMCHTITALDQGTGSSLLVGGRASPAAPMADCWLRNGETWQQVHPLPEPRFRHNAGRVSLGNGLGSIVYGGKSKNNVILDTWLFWSGNDEQGWQNVKVVGPTPEARFGAGFATIADNFGVLFGGIGNKGTILEDFWTWTLAQQSDGSLQVELIDRTRELQEACPTLFPYLTRFGATADVTADGLIIAGGIIPRQLVPAAKEILLLDFKELVDSSKIARPCKRTVISAIGLGSNFDGDRPLFTGHVSCTMNNKQTLFVGGGATCFSFGTFWTDGTWLLQPRDSKEQNKWAIVAPAESTSNSIPRIPGKSNTSTEAKEPVQIPRTKIASAAQFQQIVANGKPVVLEDSDIGPCTEKWTKEYLATTVGEERKVIVHQAQSEQMNFQSKNFAYVSKDFSTFLDEVHAGGRQYLRSISADQPSRLPASLATDFPTIKDDFKLPEYLNLVTENTHSSPLRVSGPVTMWLHYDVMANVLCQIRGERRLVLFPPDDVQSLRIPAGASSSTIDIFSTVGLGAAASIPGTSPHEAILRPGEILFIPPLWLHTACSAANEVSIAVNVFFRNLAQGYAPGRDVYGNRDLHAYEKSRQDLQKITRSFQGVPPDMARFYLRRLAQELQEIADQ